MDSEFLAQVEESKSKIRVAKKLIAEEQEALCQLVKSRGYKLYGNFYIHPDYLEEWKRFIRYGGYNYEIPLGKVVKCPLNN